MIRRVHRAVNLALSVLSCLCAHVLLLQGLTQTFLKSANLTANVDGVLGGRQALLLLLDHRLLLEVAASLLLNLG